MSDNLAIVLILAIVVAGMLVEKWIDSRHDR